MPHSNDNGLDTHIIGGSNFRFSATQIGDLDATSYTLVNIAVDVTGSVANFANQLRQALITTVESCKKSPRNEYLLVRVVEFSTDGGAYVRELHGFVPVLDIDTNAYKQFSPGGATPLYDAAYNCVGSIAEFSKKLYEEEFGVNAIMVLITDGIEGDWTGRPVSTATPEMTANLMEQLQTSEQLESILSILVGINPEDNRVVAALEAFKAAAKLTHYIDAGEATPQKLAKVANFVSESISSQSEALGTGGPSQIVATI